MILGFMETSTNLSPWAIQICPDMPMGVGLNRVNGDSVIWEGTHHVTGQYSPRDCRK